MAIYRTLLEEGLEPNYLDPSNNDGSEEMAALQDVIDSGDLNAEEVEAAQSAEYTNESVVDETFMAIAESERNWNEVMKAIGLRELSEAARGNVITESWDDVKGWFKKAKDNIVKFFKKVWQVIQRWAANISAMVVTNKKFAQKYSAQISKGYELYNAKKVDGKDLSGYKYSGISINVGASTKDYFDEAKAYNDAIREADKKLRDFEGIRAAGKDSIKADIGDSLEARLPVITINGNEYKLSEDFSLGAFRDDMIVDMRGSEDKETDYLMKPDDVKAILLDKEDSKKVVKKNMDKAKKEFKSALNVLNNLEKAIERIYKKEEDIREAAMSICTKTNAATRRLMNVNQVIRSVTLKCIRERKAQARHYGNAYVRAANKANSKYKGFQQESYNFGFLGNLDLI